MKMKARQPLVPLADCPFADWLLLLAAS